MIVLFINCIQDNFLEQHINFPTRDKNLLDLLFSNYNNLISDIKSTPPLANSDHSSFTFSINICTQRTNNNELKFNYKRGDFDKFRELLSQLDWEDKFSNKSCIEMWDIFKDNVEVLQNMCIPKIKIRPRRKRKPTWWNNNISKLIKDKNIAWDTVLKFHYQGEDLDRYRAKRDLVKKEIRKANRLDIINLSNSKNTRKLFGHFSIKSKIKNRINLLKSNDKIIEGEGEIVNEFNQYFSSVFNKKDNDFEHNIDESSESEILGNVNSIENVDINPEIIKKIILSLDVNKSGGPDSISSRILKEGVDSFSVGLSIIYSKSLGTSSVPDDWKLANVVPIFKKGSRESVNNYRPVSLTSVVCRILERVIKECTVDFLYRYNLILKTQHGFTKNRSCLTNLLEYLNYVTEMIDQGKPVDIVYLDFAKAFDKVSHYRLLYKLWSLGIRGNLLDWIRNWLIGRRQRVLLNGVKSDWSDVESGVPQGSVLGPLLFTLFINDLDLGLDCRVWKFADDTKVVRVVQNTQDCFRQQRNMDRVEGWGQKWKMEFNVNKCKVMHVGYGNLKFGYSMNGQWLQECDYEKDLGVVIDRNLKSSRQVLEARNKANRMLGFISRNVSYKSRDVVKRLYISYVRPHLEYCVQAWVPHYRQDLNMLEAVQRRATRMIHGLNRLEYKDRLQELNMFSVKRRYVRGDMIEVYKMFEGLDDLDVNDFFEVVGEGRTRGHNRKLKVKYSRLDCRKYFFSIRAVDLWNKLCRDTVNSKSLNTFKTCLDRDMSNLGYW